MRSLRLLFFLLSTLILLTCFLYLSFAPNTIQRQPSARTETSKGSFRSFFSFHSPAALFTSSATISLTDDNSTYFAATPAAFGPLVSVSGLSGEIWIGSGFGEDTLRRRGLATAVEGELGCNDIPGWIDRDWTATARESTTKARILQNHDLRQDQSPPVRHSKNKKPADHKIKSALKDEGVEMKPNAHDGTDDNFHYPLAGTTVYKRFPSERKAKSLANEHADIQSIQESAEIAGKIVLLSRGGCGFSEKVKWAQRRGAKAVIVGDNMRGEPLVRMYATGDTSNITIPSLFTSHTTAHLLSSLVPLGLDIDAQSALETSDGKSQGSEQNHRKYSRPSSSDGFIGADSKGGGSTTRKSSSLRTTKTKKIQETMVSEPKDKSLSWLGYTIRALQGGGKEGENVDGHETNSKPPRSGHTKWVKVVDFDEEEMWEKAKRKQTTSSKPQDGFVIGVHDWRDPDVVGHTSVDSGNSEGSTSSPNSRPTSKGEMLRSGPLRGGVITPGSGEYETSDGSQGMQRKQDDSKEPQNAGQKQQGRTQADAQISSDENYGQDMELDSSINSGSDSENNKASTDYVSSPASEMLTSTEAMIDELHEGLWVTLTLTSMNTHPFFNILFVLVISPLITLAVVYAMLLLRARIRQRRWRAPKSIVERLPVRVYQAFSSRSNNNSSSSSVDSVMASPVTQSTPLLIPPRSVDTMSRPRSRTVCGASGSTQATSRYGSLENSTTEQEKSEAALSAWRRQYGGKQVECVVCLEEYVDGVSKVMSLPCGHEFHADCITPWLTTRRRTCPICKGDVVRSLDQRSNSSGNVDLLHRAVNSDDVQSQVAETRNLSPSAALPVPTPALASVPAPASSQEIEVESERNHPITTGNEATTHLFWTNNIGGDRRTSGSYPYPVIATSLNPDRRTWDRSPSPDRNR